MTSEPDLTKGRRMHRVQLLDGRIYPYQIHESDRAKQVRIRLSSRDGMVVILPRGMPFRRDDMELMIQRKSRWIIRHLRRFQAMNTNDPIRGSIPLPDSLHLQAIAEKWTITYAEAAEAASASNASVREIGEGLLQVVDARGDSDRCAVALQPWIRLQATRILPTWLKELSLELRMPFSRVTIRNQRTRWGSCTGRQCISLNCKLLFVPQRWARYVLVHELCHTKVMNHGPNFWALLIRHEPQAGQIRKAMRRAWQELPPWLILK